MSEVKLNEQTVTMSEQIEATLSLGDNGKIENQGMKTLEVTLPESIPLQVVEDYLVHEAHFKNAFGHAVGAFAVKQFTANPDLDLCESALKLGMKTVTASVKRKGTTLAGKVEKGVAPQTREVSGMLSLGVVSKSDAELKRVKSDIEALALAAKI